MNIIFDLPTNDNNQQYIKDQFSNLEQQTYHQAGCFNDIPQKRAKKWGETSPVGMERWAESIDPGSTIHHEPSPTITNHGATITHRH